MFFDELITEDWDTYVSEAWDYARTLEVRRLFRAIRPRTILDVGCGCGFHDRLMAQYAFVRKVDAIDYSARSIEIAEKTYPHSKVRRTAASFEEFNTVQRYDLVVGFSIFEHLLNSKEYLLFCAQHCAASGYVAISTANRLRLMNRVRLLRRKPPGLMDVMHYREYTVKEIEEMGGEFGFEPFDRFGYGFSSVKRLGGKRNILIGYYLPCLADRIVIILRKRT